MPRLPKTKRKPAKQFAGLDPGRSEIISSSPVGTNSGISGTRMLEPVGRYLEAECEKFIHPPDHPGGCGIVLGRDRVHTPSTGYMSEGDTQAFAVRIVAGFGACHPGVPGWPKEIKGYWPDVPPTGGPPPEYFSPSNEYDGAILYLSQKSDVDEDFNCAAGTAGKIENRPAAVMKADAVRIISRDGGIKLIANTDRYHGGGERTTSLSSIDFIINNDDSTLQPLVKGYNLTDFLKEFKRWVNEILIQLNTVMLTQMDLNTSLATHRHMMPGAMMTSIPDPKKAAAGIPGPYTVAEYVGSGLAPVPEADPVVATAPSGQLAMAVSQYNSTHMQSTSPNLLSISGVLDGLERDYLNPTGPTYILSRNVNTG